MEWDFEIDWNKDGTYTAENGRLLELRITRGRSRMANSGGLEPMRAGDVYAIVENYDGRYDPYNTTGALYGYLLPGRPIRINAVEGAVSHPVFVGYVYDVRPESGRNRRAVIRATDGLTYLGRQNCTAITPQANYAVSDAIGDLLTQSTWPLVASVSTWPWTFPLTLGSMEIEDNGDTIDSFTLDASKTIEAALNEVAEAFVGTVFVTAAGSLAYRARTSPRPTAITLKQDVLLADIESLMPWDEIYNDIRVTPTVGAVQINSATASQTEYGRNTIDISSNVYIQSATQAANVADYLGVYLPVVKRGLRVRLQDRFDYQFYADLTDRVAVEIGEIGVDNLYQVGQIEHQWRSGSACTTTYRLEPDYFEVGGLQVFPFTFPLSLGW